jgi:glycosyltransferase involved in cell wall biosynthesis
MALVGWMAPKHRVSTYSRSMPEVTVVVPTHDRWKMLRTTLTSILEQRDIDLEIVVVDDGSTDRTRQLLADCRDPRLRVVRHDKPGRVSRARNSGLSVAKGSWVAFCDDDDVWAPDKLVRQVTETQGQRRLWAYCGVANIDEGLNVVSLPKTPTPEEVVRNLPRRNAIPGGGSNVIARRDLLHRVGPFRTELRNTEDWEMWLRLSQQDAPASVTARLVGYRLHHGNASLNVADILDGARRIELMHGTRVDLGNLHRWLAESCLRSGRKGAALRHWAIAAARGQAAGVAADLRTLAGSRLGVIGRPTAEIGFKGEDAEEAYLWLEALARRVGDPLTS